MCPLPSVSNVNCVLVEGRLYAGGGYMDVHDSKLFMSSTNFLEWSPLETPMATKYFALANYKSQLVLVGGKCTAGQNHVVVTNKLWTRNTLLNKWEELLSPMKVERYWPSAISTKNPEALVVAGGWGREGKEVDTVEVLMEDEWSTVQPLPKKCYGIKAIIFNERLYLAGGNRQGRVVFTCKVKSVTDKDLSKSNLWGSITSLPSEAAYMASFQQELVAFTERSKKIFAYHTFTKCWVHVGDIPKDIRVEAFPITFLDGSVAVLGSSKKPKASKLFLVSMQGKICFQST